VKILLDECVPSPLRRLNQQMKRNHRSNGAKKSPTFVSRAERAFARVARKLRGKSEAWIARCCLEQWQTRRHSIKSEMRYKLAPV
jgi:hypothetical protein